MRKINLSLMTVALCACAFDASARFVSTDPVQADPNAGDNFNRYWYANNNPYRFTDPDGRQSESVMDRRYVYSRLSPAQQSGVEAQHNEIGGQTAKGMAIGAAAATIGVVAVKSGAVAATVSAAGTVVDTVGKAAVVAEAKYAAGGVTAVVTGQRVVQAVANQAKAIEVAVKTSPVTTTALQHVDKAMDAVQGFIVPGPPPMTPAGVTAGFAQEMQKDIDP